MYKPNSLEQVLRFGNSPPKKRDLFTPPQILHKYSADNKVCLVRVRKKCDHDRKYLCKKYNNEKAA